MEKNTIQLPWEISRMILFMCKPTDEIALLSIREPTLYSIKCILLQNYIPTIKVLDEAIKVGNLDAFIMLLNRLHQTSVDFEQFYTNKLPLMALRGQSHFLKWFSEKLFVFMKINLRPVTIDWDEFITYGFLSNNINTIEHVILVKKTVQPTYSMEKFLKNNNYPIFDLLTLHKKYNSMVWLYKHGLKAPSDVAFKVAVIYKDKKMMKILFDDYDCNEDSSVWFFNRFQSYKHSLSRDIIVCAIMNGPQSLDTICNSHTELQIMVSFKSKEILKNEKCINIPEESWKWFYDHGGKLF